MEKSVLQPLALQISVHFLPVQPENGKGSKITCTQAEKCNAVMQSKRPLNTARLLSLVPLAIENWKIYEMPKYIFLNIMGSICILLTKFFSNNGLSYYLNLLGNRFFSQLRAFITDYKIFSSKNYLQWD